MSKMLVDCRGMACPQPVVETKKALEEETGKPILVVVDNGAAKENVSRFARNAGCEVKVEEKEGNFYLTISGFAEAHRDGVPPLDEAPRCDAAAGVVYFITTSAIGQGAPDLGSVLMKSLMSTLVEQQPPKALLLLNTGVHLAVEGSPVLEQLQKLSQAGSEILVCGTCLDYYKLKDKLAVGVVSNMYEINSRLTGPCKIITVG